jgi:hypothetical protein
MLMNMGKTCASSSKLWPPAGAVEGGQLVEAAALLAEAALLTLNHDLPRAAPPQKGLAQRLDV